MFVPLSERGYDEQRLGEREREGEEVEPWEGQLVIGSTIGWWEPEVIEATGEPVELELPECGYWLDQPAKGPFVMRSRERVCLGCFLDGKLTEVHGPVEEP